MNVIPLKKYQEEVISLFLDQFKSEETLRGYRFIIKDFFGVANELHVTNYMIQQVTYNRVQEYIKSLINQDKKKSTINRSINCLRSLFNYAYAENACSSNPFADTRIKTLLRVNMTKDEDEEVGRALSKAEIDKLLSIPDKYQRLIIALGLRTGLRVHEIVKVSLSDFTEREGKWFLNVLGKGRKYRVVSVNQKMIDELIEYFGEFKDKVIFPMSTSNVSRILGKWCKKLEIEPISPHSLRYSYATRLEKNGATLRQIQEVLGHKNIQTTIRYLKKEHKYDNDLSELIDY
jgi:site-specific recombinase XerD